VITELPTAPGAVDPEPFAGEDHPMRRVTREVAFDGGWSPGRAARIGELFDGLAPGWTAEHDQPARRAVLLDALERAPLPTGRCVELGSGTGLATGELASRYRPVVAVDLSAAMLAGASTGLRVRADSAWLPLRDGAADVAVLVNMLLFPAEVDRILAAGGALLWVNTLGDQTPIHLSPAEVLRALPGRWDGVTARAGTGFWLACRRARPEP
jgi:SAM-dependent methyltransferase